MLHCRPLIVAASLLATACSSSDKEDRPTRSAGNGSDTRPSVFTVPPGPGAAHALQGLLIAAVPGDTIQLEEGTYRLHQEITSTTDNITIRGRGHRRTVLSFATQNAGSEGIYATGDAFVIEDLAVEDAVGNAIKVLGADGVTIRGVRTEWTGGPKTSNGAYGLYPVQCRNVLIEDCIAIGASDAGIYVGQSEEIIVRRCRAEHNVAGIEIENSIHADVHDNVTTNNTGGILVFDLPGLRLSNGRSVRVFHNKVYSNNLPNFAPAGNIVATVPSGTGVTVMAMVDVEIFENEIRDNNTFNVAVYSYLTTGLPVKDKNYSPYPERVHVHDNVISGGGSNPDAVQRERFGEALGVPFAQIIYDGILDPTKVVDGRLPDGARGIVVNNNGDADFANLNLALLQKGEVRIDRRIADYTDSLAALPEVRLTPHRPPEPATDRAVAVYREAPRRLSDYGLFEGDGSTQRPVPGVVPYELNSQLFSDYTVKHRFVRVPAGGQVPYRSHGVLEFPVGSIIAKTFAMPRDLKDASAGERLIETRILTHEPDGWYGFAYVWNDEQTEATLSLGGASALVRWLDEHGDARQNDYIIPNANQCKSCHVTDVNAGKLVPIGPKTRNLNKDFAYADGSRNQLTHWSDLGILHGAPEAGSAPRNARADDPTSGSTQERARAWLDINCAHCHSATGPANTSGLDLTISQTDPTKLGVWKTPVAAGRGSGGREFGIVPGRPDRSILLYRLESVEPGVMMPVLPRRLVHEEGVALIRRWIAGMKGPARPGSGPAEG